MGVSSGGKSLPLRAFARLCGERFSPFLCVSASPKQFLLDFCCSPRLCASARDMLYSPRLSVFLGYINLRNLLSGPALRLQFRVPSAAWQSVKPMAVRARCVG
jgi:hypothetical protein